MRLPIPAGFIYSERDGIPGSVDAVNAWTKKQVLEAVENALVLAAKVVEDHVVDYNSDKSPKDLKRDDNGANDPTRAAYVAGIKALIEDIKEKNGI